VNGAGKTTTMSILTGDKVSTSGSAFIKGHNVLDTTIRNKFIGYCPQFDPLLDLMTGRETLTMYAHLKGIRNTMVPGVVDSALKLLGLDPFADVVAKTYSGGNKRKLSLGIALIGDPSVVLLDEPSSGMDPVARRAMWDVINSTCSHRCIVLTTHSMEECEALCSRIAIMVSGNVMCIGSSQHLKHRFGNGYRLEFTVNDSTAVDILHDGVVGFFREHGIEGVERKELYDCHMKYFVPCKKKNGDTIQLSKIFTFLEKEKERLHIKVYSVSQPSLEQVFIEIAKAGKEKQDALDEEIRLKVSEASKKCC